MYNFHIYRIVLDRTARLVPIIMIILSLIAGCAKAEPTVITIQISATPAPSATKTLPQTQVPTGMPTEAATSIQASDETWRQNVRWQI